MDSDQESIAKHTGSINPYLVRQRSINLVQHMITNSSRHIRQVFQPTLQDFRKVYRKNQGSKSGLDRHFISGTQRPKDSTADSISTILTSDTTFEQESSLTDECTVDTQVEYRSQSEIETVTEEHDQQDNVRWGDNIFQTKKKGACRIYFQNIHGLRPNDTSMGKWIDSLQVMEYYNVDIFGFVETCTNWNKKRLAQRYNKQAKYQFPLVNIHHSIVNYQTDSDYLPGGVMHTTTGHWTGRIKKSLSDPHKMGRWTGAQYILNEHQSMYVITMYRVYKDASVGVNSTCTQQMLALRARFGPNHGSHPRKQVITDFIQYITDLNISQQDHLLVMLDANEVLGEDQHTGLQELMQRLRLIDLFQKHHGHECEIATHMGSSHRRIDYILGTVSLVPHIQGCGYLPFNKGLDSDHRGLFIDLGTSLTKGELQLKSPPARMIGLSTCKKELANYKQQVLQEFRNLDIPNRAAMLYDQASPALEDDPEFMSKLNKLDQDVATIVLNAEKKCCTKKPPFPWSVEVHQASLLIKYWTIKYNHRNKKRNIKEQLKKIYDQLPKESQISIDIADPKAIRANLRMAKRAKKELYQQHRQHKREQSEQRHAIHARYSGRPVEQEKKQYEHRKKDDQLYTYLRTVYPKTRGRGISAIEIPDRDAKGEQTSDPLKAVTWKTVNDPKIMTDALIKRNIAHFGQSKHSPFADTALQSEYGYQGTNRKTTQLIFDQHISSNIAQDPHIHSGAKAILNKLSDGNFSPPLSDTITFEDFWSAFNKWDEKTSTSPSTRHLGHYKSLLTADGREAVYTDDHPNPSTEIQHVYYHIAMAAVMSANTLDRWARSATMMIEKTPGQPRIHRLRVIHLYEADYNLLLKILWARKLVHHSHRLDQLHSAQAGSRPDNRCIDVVLRKELNYQYSRLTRTGLATVDNDAKACYDRIICNLAMMVSQYHGMSNRACKFHSKTLERMKFTVRTAGGDSKQSYHHTEATPIHGSGQGSCASPSLWLHISSILLHIHATLAQGMTRHDVSTDNSSHISAEGFVDDISLFINNPQLHMEALDLLIQAIRNDLHIWQDLLAGSGGKLELDKCFYYILAWKFNKFGDAIPKSLDEIKAECQTHIGIHDPDSETEIPLQVKDINQDHKTLGVLKTMSGDETAQLEALKNKSKKLAIQTAVGQLTRFQARRAYSSIYMPLMLYSLVATSLTEADLNVVQSKALQSFLPAMGYEATFPRAVIYGPRQFGGINLGHLYTEMCITKIEAIVSHIQSGSGLGQLMETNLNWLQLHSGLSTPVLNGGIPITYLQMNWFLHVRDFLYSVNGKIVIPNQWQLVLERQRDMALMDKVLISEELQKSEKRIFNNWRLFFQVSNLSDIIEPSGTKVQEVYWKLSQNQSTSPRITWRSSRHHWPIQHAPDPSTFKIWRKVLRIVFQIDSTGCLQQSLGDWIIPCSQSRNKWKAYLNPHTYNLYILHDSRSYMVYDLVSSISTRTILEYSNAPEDIVETVPDNCFPVQYETLGAGYQVANRISSYRSPKKMGHRNTRMDFDMYLTTLPKWRSDLLLHWQTISVEQLCFSYQTDEDIIIASDGSYIKETGQGSFGVVVANSFRHLMTVQGIAPGTSHLHSSFRSELYGVLAASILLIEVTKFCNLPVKQGQIVQFYIDNKGVIDRVQRHREVRPYLGEYMSTDIDVELQVLQELETLSNLGYKVKQLRHVKSHQDKHMSVHLLPWEAQLNVEADRLAGMMHDHDFATIEYSVFPTTKAQLWLKDECITAKCKESLRNAYHTQDLREYYEQKFGWESATIDQIWWDVFGTAIKKLSNADRQRIQKYNVRRLHTNNRRHIFDKSMSDSCKHCGQTEDNDHIVQCSHCSQNRKTIKAEWVTSVMEFLSIDHTPPSVRMVIMTALTSWMNQLPIPSIHSMVPNASVRLVEAYISQNSIGWDNFLRGKLSHKWEAIISTHLKDTGNPITNITAEQWGVQLIGTLWQGILSLWEARNTEYHGDDFVSQSRQERLYLLEEAQRLKQLGQNCALTDQQWFQSTEEELEKYSVFSLKAWVRNARTMIRLQRQEQKVPVSRLEAEQISQLFQQSGILSTSYYYRQGMRQ